MRACTFSSNSGECKGARTLPNICLFFPNPCLHICDFHLSLRSVEESKTKNSGDKKCSLRGFFFLHVGYKDTFSCNLYYVLEY